MPRLPRITVPVLADLAAQLRYAPPSVLRRAISSAESLPVDLDPEGQYPAEWVIYRITKYRPESTTSAPSPVARGAALLADLSAFVEQLCDAAEMKESELAVADENGSAPPATGATRGQPEFLTPDALATSWNISRKTLDRCRRKGLIARRVMSSGGKVKVYFSAAAAEAFRARHGYDLFRAAEYSRIDPAEEALMVRRAARYRATLNCSLNQAAKQLAKKFGRSHEGIRQLLQRHERRKAATAPGTRAVRTTGAARAGSGDVHPISDRSSSLAYRAWRRAIEPAEIAERLGHRKQAVMRAILLERLSRLRGVLPSLAGHTSPTFVRAGAAKAVLEPAPVREDLAHPVATDLSTFLATARMRTVPVGAEEMARAVAYHFLLWRAASAIAKASHLHPSATAIDRIETDLRWASRLHAQLVRSQVPLMVQTIEGRLGALAGSMKPSEAAGIITAGIRSIAEAVQAFDPFRAATSGARLAGSVSPAVTRLAAQWAKDHASRPPPHRAVAVYTSSPPLPDWTISLDPWQAFLEPDPRIGRTLGKVDPAARSFLLARFGWNGAPPQTLAELAAQLNITAMQVGSRERKNLRLTLVVARGSEGHSAV